MGFVKGGGAGFGMTHTQVLVPDSFLLLNKNHIGITPELPVEYIQCKVTAMTVDVSE